MRRTSALAVASCILLSSLFLQGCASNKHLTKNDDFRSSEPIKVGRHETPGIMKSTSVENAVLGLATVGAPGGSALLVLGDQYAKVRGAGAQAAIPDFGYLVMDKFVAQIESNHPEWPPLVVIQEPLSEELSEKCTVIEFKVNRVAYGSLDLARGGIILERGLDKGFVSKGFLSKVTATMKDAQGEVLWRKSYLYLSENFDRAMSLDELEAENFTLLKEEMDFAAERTAMDFIESLTEDQSETATQGRNGGS